jgi:carboxylesterase type B
MGAPVARGILQSGSLYLSPPQPVEKGASVIASLSSNLKAKHNVSLSDAPTSLLLQQLIDDNINPLWIQQEQDLLGWEDRLGDVQDLLIGDVEYEAVIWRNGLENVPATEIASAFDDDELRRLYCVSPSRPTASRLGAVDFINDARFALPVEEIAATRRKAGKRTYQYVFDQVNPWQSSSRAHHAVDLVFLFGAYDLSFNPAAAAVAKAMQDRWITFVSGESPWDSEKRFAFGPLGKSAEITDEEFAARRRVGHFGQLRELGTAKLGGIFGTLAAGRVSLLN